MKKRILFLLFLFLNLCALMVAVSAANLTVETPKTAAVNSTFTVKLNTSAMKVASFTGGIRYDKEKLSVVAINGTPTVGIKRAADNTVWKALVHSTPAEAAAGGNVGFAFVNRTEAAYLAGTFAEITFKVLAPGAAKLTVYEDSDGANGGSFTQTKTITCGGASLTGRVVSYNPQWKTTITLRQSGAVKYTAEIAPATGTGRVTQTFTMQNVAAGTYDLVIQKDGHLTYTIKGVVLKDQPLDLTAAAGKPYSTITLLVGDVDNSGCIDSDDLYLIWDAEHYNGAAAAAGLPLDLDGDGLVNAADLNLVWNASQYNRNAENHCTHDFG